MEIVFFWIFLGIGIICLMMGGIVPHSDAFLGWYFGAPVVIVCAFLAIWIVGALLLEAFRMWSKRSG